MDKPKVRQSDWDHICDYIYAEVERRKKDRKHLDHVIKEIDRQVSMRPDKSHKMKMSEAGTPTAILDPQKAWLPEIELPLQAEALEILTSDARSMMFPDSGVWFMANAALTDEYLERADFESIIAGDENDVPSRITQDNANKLAAGLLNHYHKQYDFRGHVDVINAEAFSYGCGVGRARMVTKEVVTSTAKGIVSKQKRIPVLIPKSLKNTYLDDREHIIMNEGHHVSPLTIFYEKVSLEDIKKAAKKGGNDPDKDTGGWMLKNINKLEEEKDGHVEIYEAEGDFIIPRKTGKSLYIPGTIITIACGKNKKVIRVRLKKHIPNSIIVFPYHNERVGSPYATSPLMKGWPIQVAAVEMLMRIAESAALKNAPPIGYDRNDQWFIQNGGPVVHPNAQWGTMGEVNVYDNIGGDQSALLAIYQSILQQYADVVGVHRARS